MNIIQIQDRLKGLPTEALVNYVEQPMGEVPIYLALGELQRRKEMKERFMADQMPPPSVAEQIVAENKPQPVGIARMAPQRMMPKAQGVGAPQPAPQIDPRQMAASGIAANPVSNVGGPAMMAAGGIVPGYAAGTLIRSGLGAAKNFLFGRGPQAYGARTFPTIGNISPYSTRFMDEGIPNLYTRAPRRTIGAGLLGLGFLPALFGGDPESTDNEDVVAPVINTPTADLLPSVTTKEGADLFLEQLGDNDVRTALATRLTEKQERIAKDREDAANMALIQAGLNIAAGQSPDALTNIAAGATTGLQDYTKRLKDVDKAELQTMQLQEALNQAERAEQIAAIKFGEQSKQFRDSYNLKIQLQEMILAGTMGKTRAAVIKDIKDSQEYMRLENELAKLVKEEEITRDTYNKRLDNFINQKLAGLYSSSSMGTTTTAPVEITTKEELDALPSGTTYKGPDGQLYKKN